MSQQTTGPTPATDPTGSRRRGRTILVVLLIAGFIGAGSALWPWLSGKPAGSATATPTVSATTAAATPSASPLSSEAARAEYYRLHPRSTGWWQWVLIGGIVVLLIIIGIVLLRAPPARNGPQDR